MQKYLHNLGVGMATVNKHSRSDAEAKRVEGRRFDNCVMDLPSLQNRMHLQLHGLGLGVCRSLFHLRVPHFESWRHGARDNYSALHESSGAHRVVRCTRCAAGLQSSR